MKKERAIKPKLRLLTMPLILFFCFGLMSCKYGRMIIYNVAGIDDYKIFPSRPLKKSQTPFTFYRTDTAHRKFPKSITSKAGTEMSFGDFLTKKKTVAFIIIHHDTIQYEHYFNGYSRHSIVNSFSMAKSILSILIGCAIDDGLIHSVNDPVTKYIPELRKNGFAKVSIKNLLQMTSGLKFSEGYLNPFSGVASLYYGRHLKKQVLNFKLSLPPGTKFNYQSGSTEILGLILNRALKDKSITQYLQEKIWTPLQMTYNAGWSVDHKDGLEKTFCCLNARAIDFAKIGRLYLDKGNWNGQQVVSASWVKNSTKVDTSDGSAWFYQYQWWLPTTTGDFYADGLLGQYIYVNPNKGLIIVRLGKATGKDVNWPDIFMALAKQY